MIWAKGNTTTRITRSPETGFSPAAVVDAAFFPPGAANTRPCAASTMLL